MLLGCCNLLIQRIAFYEQIMRICQPEILPKQVRSVVFFDLFHQTSLLESPLTITSYRPRGLNSWTNLICWDHILTTRNSLANCQETGQEPPRHVPRVSQRTGFPKPTSLPASRLETMAIDWNAHRCASHEKTWNAYHPFSGLLWWPMDTNGLFNHSTKNVQPASIPSSNFVRSTSLLRLGRWVTGMPWSYGRNGRDWKSVQNIAKFKHI